MHKWLKHEKNQLVKIHLNAMLIAGKKKKKTPINNSPATLRCDGDIFKVWFWVSCGQWRKARCRVDQVLGSLSFECRH